MDAALGVAIYQVARCAGAWASLAGILSLLYFDAQSGRVHSLNGGFQTLLEERCPRSIPRSGKPSGRSVLTPGFLAAVQAAHQRFGRCPWPRLFQDAIGLAVEGFSIDRDFAGVLRNRWHWISRLPEGKAIFAGKDGGPWVASDRLRQPALAETLRQIALHGADHCYRGEWARRFVALVRREGGVATERDLDSYQPIWSEPLHARVRDSLVFAPGLPASGGVYLVEALNLLDCSQLAPTGNPASDVEFLYWLIQIARARYLPSSIPAGVRAQREAAEGLGAKMRAAGRWQILEALKFPDGSMHSDAVVARDHEGNVAALCHSINTFNWGTTGLFLDGVSISDSASFHQEQIEQAGPGERIPDAMNPTIALQGGQPIVACAAIGASLHELTVQNLVDLLLPDPGVRRPECRSCFLQPGFGGLYCLGRWQGRYLTPATEKIFEWVLRALLPIPSLMRRFTDLPARFRKGDVSSEIVRGLERMGQRVETIDADPRPATWVSLHIQPEIGMVGATRTTAVNPVGCWKVWTLEKDQIAQ
jgi:gamma-glutamyltranspeptidase/glutathione hydrolase